MTVGRPDVRMDENAGNGPRECCSTPAEELIAHRFDRRAGRWTRTGGFPDMVGVSRRLLAQLRDVADRRPSILELGCGTGALSIALLLSGASRVTGIDLSPTSIDLARRRAAAFGVAERARFSVGNAATQILEPHDWVVLDRSICCFEAGPRLVSAAIAAAGERVAISAPESRAWRGSLNRAMWTAENALNRLRGGCPGYVHDLRTIEARLADAGFRPAPGRASHAGLWSVVAYAR